MGLTYLEIVLKVVAEVRLALELCGEHIRVHLDRVARLKV